MGNNRMHDLRHIHNMDKLTEDSANNCLMNVNSGLHNIMSQYDLHPMCL